MGKEYGNVLLNVVLAGEMDKILACVKKIIDGGKMETVIYILWFFI